MNFQINGTQHKMVREDILQATQGVAPSATDGRHKYFVKLHNRQYPIKQVIRLATGLTPAEFTSHDAHRILTSLDFDVSLRPSLENGETRPPGWGQSMSLVVVFETDEDGWEVASCPILPGCHSQGRTRGEALANIQEAIMGYLASMREHGEAAPSLPEFTVVEVTA